MSINSKLSMANSCFVCSAKVRTWGQILPIDDKLAKTWVLSKKERYLFQIREGKYCPSCNNSMRTIGLAKIITSIATKKSNNFSDFIDFANQHKLKVAEINGCGNLHPFLSKIPQLTYSEYGYNGKKQKGMAQEDIQNLSYPNDSFNFVLHSETLEHVPDPKKALEECNRILKPGGWCIFTIPILWNRNTVSRIELKNGKLYHKKTKSYHGGGNEDCIVWREFGGDILKQFTLMVFAENSSAQSYIFAFQKDKKEYKTQPKKYMYLEKLALLRIKEPKETKGAL